MNNIGISRHVYVGAASQTLAHGLRVTAVGGRSWQMSSRQSSGDLAVALSLVTHVTLVSWSQPDPRGSCGTRHRRSRGCAGLASACSVPARLIDVQDYRAIRPYVACAREMIVRNAMTRFSALKVGSRDRESRVLNTAAAARGCHASHGTFSRSVSRARTEREPGN
jgi:hypothetical protein